MSHSSSRRLLQQAFALSFLALFGLGCGLGSGVTVQDNGSTFDVQGTQNQGVRFGENITIPETFPTDIPRYAGATTKIALKDGDTYTVSQETTDDIDTVIRSLDQQLTQNGYTLGVRIGNVGEPVQIIDYNNATKQTTIRLQVSRDAGKNLTQVMTARVPKAQ